MAQSHILCAERMRILVVFGTRPEAIKMIPVIRALGDSGVFRPIVISTGQHSDMVEELIEKSGLRLDVNLHASDPVEGRRPTLNEMVARIMVGIDRTWQSDELPSEYQSTGRRSVHGAKACLVHGDTSSALAAAIAAFNLQIPVFHVEAGLRTSNVLSPFPEEGNRQVISRIAAFHLAPTAENKTNLVRERVNYARILVTGNTSIDMLHWAARQEGGFGPGLEDLEARYFGDRSQRYDGEGFASPHVLPDAPRIVLVTAHRRENWGKGLQRVADAVLVLSRKYPEIEIVMPMHPNPIVRAPMLETLGGLSNVHLVGPREYLDFARLMAAATLIITDSGGVQEEAPALGTPVLVTRKTTERQEGVKAGTLILVGTDPEMIVRSASGLLDDAEEYAHYSNRPNPYGDGHAAERIVAALRHIFLDGPAPAEFTSGEMRSAVLRRLGLTEFGEGETTNA